MFPVLRWPTVADHDCGNLITLCLLSENLTLWIHHYLHHHHPHLNDVVIMIIVTNMTKKWPTYQPEVNFSSPLTASVPNGFAQPAASPGVSNFISCHQQSEKHCPSTLWMGDRNRNKALNCFSACYQRHLTSCPAWASYWLKSHNRGQRRLIEP